MYKIAVYAMCKNEVNFVDKWFNSMLEADYVCILDTGSNDGTYEALQAYAAKYPGKVIVSQKVYSPWRFDTPRNDSMDLVPEDADILICTDLDEILIPGWANDFRATWNPNLTRMYYYYAWSHTADGAPARVFLYDKCHCRHGWKWKYPVHETLYYEGNAPQYQATVNADKIYLHHYPVHKDSRSSYLPLLKLRAEENPDDFYGLVYLAHEYYYSREYQNCIDYITNTVLPKIPVNDNYLCETDLYLFLGDAYNQLGETAAATKAYKKGIAVCPEYRENYLGLAKLFMSRDDFGAAIDTITDMFANTKRFYSWLERDTSWTWEPYDLLSLAYFYNGNKELSYDYAVLASTLNPTDERLKDNVKIIKDNIKKE